MYKDINDYELLYLIAENNEDAYNNMHDKYHNIIKIEANKYLSKCPYIGVSYDDLYQAGLYGLELAIRNFSDNADCIFYTCASTYIKREICTFIRSQSRNKHRVLSQSVSLDTEIGEDTLLQDYISDNINISDVYINNENNREILNLKYELPYLQSLVYELKLNHFSNKEIAILLDKPYKSIDNAVSSIKNRLRNKNKIAGSI